MSYKLILVILLGCLVSCCKGRFITDKVETPYTEVQTRNCTKYDLCMRCGELDSFGNVSCGYKFSPFCPGNKKVIVKVTKYVGHYEKEPTKTVVLRKEEIIKDLTKCN